MTITTDCKCTNGRVADKCRANRREVGLRYYLGELDAFARKVNEGTATLSDCERAEVLSAEWETLFMGSEECLTA
ncbi:MULTISPECIES: hypothetical protein [unclassified Streptomyces]|uniref:hypothetical protein n=1 Tax=Streptomyces sp. NPDC056835 TaxID=3345956 RepID=UPI0036893AD2